MKQDDHVNSQLHPWKLLHSSKPPLPTGWWLSPNPHLLPRLQGPLYMNIHLPARPLQMSPRVWKAQLIIFLPSVVGPGTERWSQHVCSSSSNLCHRKLLPSPFLTWIHLYVLSTLLLFLLVTPCSSPHIACRVQIPIISHLSYCHVSQRVSLILPLAERTSTLQHPLPKPRGVHLTAPLKPSKDSSSLNPKLARVILAL